MNADILKHEKQKRLIGASGVLAATLLGGTLCHSIAGEQLAGVWLGTALYMFGPILAAVLVLPLVDGDWWLFTTAVLLSLAILLPWALVDPARWAASLMPQLGLWAHVLFTVLLVSGVAAKRLPRQLAWTLSGFYLLILLLLPLVL